MHLAFSIQATDSVLVRLLDDVVVVVIQADQLLIFMSA